MPSPRLQALLLQDLDLTLLPTLFLSVLTTGETETKVATALPAEEVSSGIDRIRIKMMEVDYPNHYHQ
jgi:hypothetical protein